MSYRSLALVCVVMALALIAILARLFAEYQRGSLSRRSLLVGGFLFAGIIGLFAAGVQILLQGPGL